MNAIPQEQLAWMSWLPEDIMREARAALDVKREGFAKVKVVLNESRHFENTIYALEKADYQLRETANCIEFFLNISPREEIRKVAKETIEMIEQESVDIAYDKEIYETLKAYESKKPALEGADQKLFQDTLRDYRRMGFDLPTEKQERIKEIAKRIAVLANEFSNNINNWDESLAFTKEDLEGLPEAYINNLRKTSEGKYLVSAKRYPESGPFMENVTNAEKRKALAHLMLQKGGEKNLEILNEIISLRKEHANLLGYPNHAAYVIEVKMAKMPEVVWGFLNSLTHALKNPFQKEMEDLRDLKRRLTNNSSAEIEYYDTAYFTEQLRRERFNIESEKLREYFPLESVLKGMFTIYQTLFSVRFERIEGISLWHEDVSAWGVCGEDGRFLATFFLDLFPREAKYGHAAMFPLKGGYTVQNKEYVPPMAALVTNFPKPSAKKPSLLKHSEIETLFHEFGHVMHGLLTRAKYLSQSGTRVARDFVEAPSQMLEGWVWDKEILKTLSLKEIPDEVVENIVKSKYHMIAHHTMRQIIFGIFDMTLHTEGTENPSALYNKLVWEFQSIHLPEDAIFPAGFGHLIGYDAGYYGYLWSEVYAADMFTRFKKEGLLNPETGISYRRAILEQGSSREEIDSVREFLGREPSNEAFLKEIGL